MEGRLFATISRILDCIPNAEVTIAAPVFESHGHIPVNVAHLYDTASTKL
jgi:hypothetical protein